MIRSTLTTPVIRGGQELHAAIIMDGNGRWAEARGRPRRAGHAAGTAAVRKVVEAAPDLGITILSLYAFSSDNWRRPPAEVGHLMHLFRKYLDTECQRLEENGVRLSVFGRRDRIPASLVRCIERAEEATRAGKSLHLRLAIDYSARDAIVAAASRLDPEGPASRWSFERCLSSGTCAPGDSTGPVGVDLLIRTGGERRLSDFLLWESAYAELVFIDVLWPDFSPDDLTRAVRDFFRRERRFGGLSPRPPEPSADTPGVRPGIRGGAG